MFQSDNNSDKKQASDTTDDVFNNNNGSKNKDASNFHSTALIKDVIHKKQEAESKLGEGMKKEMKEKIEADLSDDVFKMSLSAKVTTKVIYWLQFSF